MMGLAGGHFKGVKATDTAMSGPDAGDEIFFERLERGRDAIFCVSSLNDQRCAARE